MVWWFFKKKDDEEKWIQLHESLINSFQKIKEQMVQTHKKIEYGHDVHSKTLNHLDTRIAKLERMIYLVTERKEAPYPMDPLELNIKSSKEEILIDSLSSLHKKIVSTAHRVGKENGNRWITMKKISEECYIGKKYSDIKSTLSTYTDNLVELNLLNKKRKGRNTYLSLTEKAIHLLPTIEKELGLEEDMEVR